jgi:hypothetical protein
VARVRSEEEGSKEEDDGEDRLQIQSVLADVSQKPEMTDELTMTSM